MKTRWFVRSAVSSTLAFSNHRRGLEYICGSVLRKYFDVPASVVAVRFVAKKRRGKWTTCFWWCPHSGLLRYQGRIVALYPGFRRYLEERFPTGYYHVECHYEDEAEEIVG